MLTVHAYRAADRDRAGSDEDGGVLDTENIAFEGAVIGHAETHKRDKRPSVGFRHRDALQITVIGQRRVYRIQPGEQRRDRLRTALLGAAEAGFVDAIADRIVNQRVPAGDIRAQHGGM